MIAATTSPFFSNLGKKNGKEVLVNLGKENGERKWERGVCYRFLLYCLV
jgi:hypothetical protein